MYNDVGPKYTLPKKRCAPSEKNINFMGSHQKGERGGSSNGSGGGAVAVDKGVDFAQYFCTYAFLYHQKEMLSDRVRMDAYFNAIFENKHHFKGKVPSLFLCFFL